MGVDFIMKRLLQGKKWLGICLVLCLFAVFGSACGNQAGQPDQGEGDAPALALEGKSLFVYCGAGMTKPFQEIVDAFQAETGAKVEVTFGNAAQIVSQITTAQQGDLFVAGDQGELEKIKDEYVAKTTPLVKHIPVIAVPKGNPKGIASLQDFAQEGVRVVLGDNQATPIGKLADKALKEAGVFDQVDIIARSATAPEITNALDLGECDAAILWKENATGEGIEIVPSVDLEPYVKTIPAAELKCGTNAETLAAFMEFLNSDKAHQIWQNYGYELAE